MARKIGYSKETFRGLYERHNGNVIAMERTSGLKLITIISKCKKDDLEPKGIPKSYSSKKRKPACWTENWAVITQ